MDKWKELIAKWKHEAWLCPRDYQQEERVLENCADELEALLPELGAADPQPGELARLRAVAVVARDTVRDLQDPARIITRGSLAMVVMQRTLSAALAALDNTNPAREGQKGDSNV